MANFLNLTGLTTLLSQLKQKYAATSEVAAVEADTNTYVLNIDYANTLAFDIKEIITSENDDITLEENESLVSTESDEILITTNDEYIIIEKGD